ncbi:hypothetical protein F5X68DRAFT_56388 [Plectosphaerella plurivora]|uniref:Uncharacterized protein n=1 Tax=Plectosphaerella plurivora TaxID=936078 RepID=A0A9P8V1U3_9PEZI|nr:hypothetical protein F5X68DRAFT_56388 [Plectosphaerella plurivora]
MRACSPIGWVPRVWAFAPRGTSAQLPRDECLLQTIRSRGRPCNSRTRPQRRVDSLLLPTTKWPNDAETGSGVILADNGALILQPTLASHPPLSPGSIQMANSGAVSGRQLGFSRSQSEATKPVTAWTRKPRQARQARASLRVSF